MTHKDAPFPAIFRTRCKGNRLRHTAFASRRGPCAGGVPVSANAGSKQLPSPYRSAPTCHHTHRNHHSVPTLHQYWACVTAAATSTAPTGGAWSTKARHQPSHCKQGAIPEHSTQRQPLGPRCAHVGAGCGGWTGLSCTRASPSAAGGDLGHQDPARRHMAQPPIHQLLSTRASGFKQHVRPRGPCRWHPGHPRRTGADCHVARWLLAAAQMPR